MAPSAEQNIRVGPHRFAQGRRRTPFHLSTKCYMQDYQKRAPKGGGGGVPNRRCLQPGETQGCDERRRRPTYVAARLWRRSPQTRAAMSHCNEYDAIAPEGNQGVDKRPSEISSHAVNRRSGIRSCAARPQPLLAARAKGRLSNEHTEGGIPKLRCYRASTRLRRLGPMLPMPRYPLKRAREKHAHRYTERWSQGQRALHRYVNGQRTDQHNLNIGL